MPRKKHFELTYRHVFERFVMGILPTNHPLISIQLFNEATVLDLFQDRRIDEVTGVEIFHFRPGLGELINDRLDSFAIGVRDSSDQSLGHFLIGHLYKREIVLPGIFFQDVQRNVFVGFENIDAFEIGFHESDDDVPIGLNVTLPHPEAMHRVRHAELA